MKNSTRLFILGLFILIFASLILLLPGSVEALPQETNGVSSPQLAIGVSTHGNVDFAGRTEEPFQYAPFMGTCIDCHSSHGSSNLATILTTIYVNRSLAITTGPIVFTARTGLNSFDDGVSAETSRVCVACHVNANRPGSATAMSHAGGFNHLSGADYSGVNCTTCHPHDADGNPATIDGFMPVAGACDSCHGAPPATGSHSTHSNPAVVPTIYGETGVHSSPTAYDFACGECHPTDVSKHMDGTVEVVLPSTGAPVGSLKARNAVSASYDPTSKTCGGAYCHSGERVAPTGPVDWPLVDSSGNPILDSHYNPTYAPYTSSKYREYTSPVWGVNLPNNGGPEGTCDSCHQFPLTTSFRDGVMGGAVDSHQWIGPDPFFGGTWGSLHAYSYMAEPIPCRTCHYQTVTAKDSLTNAQRFVYNSFGDYIAVFGAIPVADRTFHVNGNQDVAFDIVDTVGFYTNTGLIQMPVAGTYFPAQKSCGNVSCHGSNLPALIGQDIGGQNYVVWGAPYHIYESPTNEGCEFCHRPGGYSGKWYPVLPACSTCHPAMASVENVSRTSFSLFQKMSYNPLGHTAPLLSVAHPSGTCIGCHTPHMTDAASDPGSWTIDKIPPETQIDTFPANPSFEPAAVFTFSSPDADAVFECSLNGAEFTACTNPQSYNGLAQASYTFDVRAKDSMGNIDPTPASYTWTVYKILTAEFESSPANDGWILKFGDATNAGGPTNDDGFLYVGDSPAKKQYRSILDFNTTSLPDTAVIKTATVQIKKAGATGIDPFPTHGPLIADMTKGFYGSSASLQATDFNVAGTPASPVGNFLGQTNNWYQLTLEVVNFQYINPVGRTQFRIRFTLSHDNDHEADIVSFYSGNSIKKNNPLLTIQYYVP